MANISDIYELAKKLNLWNIARGDVDLTDRSLSNLEFLEKVLLEELRFREESKVIKLRKASKLPSMNFDEKRLTDGIKWHYRKLMQLAWIDENTNLVVIGSCGVGKTSMVTTLGLNVINNENKVYYCKFDEFLNIVKNKAVVQKYKKTFDYIKECDVIIVDELFYLSISVVDLELVYRTLIFLNESRSLVLITNRELSDWKEVCDDKHLVTTFLERLTKGSEIIRLVEKDEM